MLLALLLWVADTPAEPVVSERVEHYELHGTTRQELLDDLARAQRRSGKLGRLMATTEWGVGWGFGYGGTPECSIGAVEVRVEIVTTMPDWKDQDRAPGPLAGAWDRFTQALERHEKGHADIALDAARAVRDRLLGVPPADTCDGLKADADAAARAVVDEFHERERRFDLATAHGTTQGVVFR